MMDISQKLRLRIQASIFLLLLVSGAAWAGTLPLAILALAAWLLGVREYWRMTQGGAALKTHMFYPIYGVFLCVAGAAGTYLALTGGVKVMLWPLLMALVTDTGAYFFGSQWGGRKLWPQVSPGKTWVGAWGGLLCALLADALYWQNIAWPHTVIAAVASLAVQGGDLAESYLKRLAGTKDSGRLLPGHGGVLDRIDGLLAVIIWQAIVVLCGARGGG